VHELAFVWHSTFCLSGSAKRWLLKIEATMDLELQIPRHSICSFDEVGFEVDQPLYYTLGFDGAGQE